jgi:hypothetical protein
VADLARDPDAFRRACINLRNSRIAHIRVVVRRVR